MTPEQVSVFMEERKWDYRGTGVNISCNAHRLTQHATAFGFVAALLERIPLLGLVFSVSNRVGAAMWAVGM